MAKQTISETVIPLQFLRDQISVQERLSGLNCAAKKSLMAKPRSSKENRKAFRYFLKRSESVFV